MTRWRRHPNATTTTLDGEAFVVRADTDTILRLNPTATALWNALTETANREDLLSLFAAAFPDQPRARLRDDLDRTLAALAETGMIETDDP